MGKFPLNYAGTQSQFEGRTVAPSLGGRNRLRIIAVDRAGNTGLHELPLEVKAESSR